MAPTRFDPSFGWSIGLPDLDPRMREGSGVAVGPARQDGPLPAAGLLALGTARSVLQVDMALAHTLELMYTPIPTL